jgi:hypothetical protein
MYSIVGMKINTDRETQENYGSNNNYEDEVF